MEYLEDFEDLVAAWLTFAEGDAEVDKYQFSSFLSEFVDDITQEIAEELFAPFGQFTTLLDRYMRVKLSQAPTPPLSVDDVMALVSNLLDEATQAGLLDPYIDSGHRFNLAYLPSRPSVEEWTELGQNYSAVIESDVTFRRFDEGIYGPETDALYESLYGLTGGDYTMALWMASPDNDDANKFLDAHAEIRLSGSQIVISETGVFVWKRDFPLWRRRRAT